MKEVFNGNGRNPFPRLLADGGQPSKQPALISDLFHQCKIIVNETGTEAAAATGIVSGLESFSLNVDFKVDRPALFYMYQKSTGAILFMG